MDFIHSVELKLFHKAIENYKIYGEFLPEDAVSLYWVFGQIIKQVFEIVDSDLATVIKSSSSSKILVQVSGGDGKTYWVPPGNFLCQCYPFRHAHRDYCKHILAAHIVLSLQDKSEYETWSEIEIDEIFNTIINPPKM